MRTSTMALPSLLLCTTLTVFCCHWAWALDNGLARTPPMGWMSTERFQCNVNCQDYPNDCISEDLVKSTADAMQYRFQQSGYVYVTLGDCWMAKDRDTQGNIQPDPQRFPNGMKPIADYLHQRSLKLGLLLDAGNATCNGYPGSAGHYKADAAMLASWGVDMLKFSACSVENVTELNSAFPEMGHELNKTGRPILYLCEWASALRDKGAKIDYQLISDTCNQFRTYKDVVDSWDSLHDMLHFYGDNSHQFVNYSKPGSWNDPDQLVVGDYGLSENQQALQMSVWAVMGAPLFVSADMRRLSDFSRSLLLNQDIIAINQDALGIVGQQITVSGQVRIWRRPILPKGSFALALLYENVSGYASKVSVKLQDLGLTTASVYNLTELTTRTAMGLYKPWYTLDCEVNPTGVLLIRAVALDGKMGAL